MKVHVPHDVLLNHILPRLPPKSIGCFRCVSKEWRSFLTSDMFQNKHIDHHQDNIKLLVFSKTETASLFEFTTIDCETPPSDKGLTPTRRPLPQFGDTTSPLNIRILTSFHGLVCLGIIKNKDECEYSHLILWNPLTNEYKRLSKYNFYEVCHCIISDSIFGLYYSSCEDDYKLLLLKTFRRSYQFYIYSLKSDSWREVDASQTRHIFLRPGLSLGFSRGTYLNENLYFLQDPVNKGRLPSIIRFDTKTERLSKIETPDVRADIPDAYNNYATIVVKSDCIHVCVKYDIRDNGFGRTTCIKLWKLDEHENMKEVSPYQLRPQVNDIAISSLRPFYCMKNGNWLMMKNWWSSYEHEIYKVDLKKGKHVKDYDDDYESAEVRVDGNNNNIVLEQGRYIETFVSPNRYMK